MVIFRLCVSQGIFLWRRKRPLAILFFLAIFIVTRRRDLLGVRSRTTGGVRMQDSDHLTRGVQDETKQSSKYRPLKKMSHRRSLPRALVLNITRDTKYDAQSKTGTRNASRESAARCRLTQLATDDRQIDEAFGSCRFAQVTNEEGFDEKIDNLDAISLPLLKNYRNPCWYEALPVENGYRDKVHMFWPQVRPSFERMSKVLQERRKKKHLWRLRCLPFVYIIGMACAGKVDLHFSLLQHPHVTTAATKESFYWSRDRWKWRSPISDYLDLFDEAAERIRKLTVSRPRQGAFHPMVTVDGSVNYLYEFGGARTLKLNSHGEEPRHLAPHLIRNLTPNTDIKVVLILRNPTDRLFAAFCQYNAYGSISPELFHRLAEEQVARLDACFEKHSLKSCVYDKRVTKSTEKVEVFSGIYHVFVRDWLAVFPRMKVVTWEEYKVNKLAIYADLLDYIGLDGGVMKTKISNFVDEDRSDVAMLVKTKHLLDKFYGPHNKRLAELLAHDKFSFTKH